MADVDLRASGIYVIRNAVNGKVYVGSAISIIRRWTVHRCDLKHHRHRSSLLQRAWDKYGSAAFEFEVLEFVPDKQNLVAREQHWIDCLRAHIDHGGYNYCPMAASRLGMKMSALARARIGAAHKGRKMTEEARASMKAGWLLRDRAVPQQVRDRVSAALKGRKHSPDHVAKVAASNRAKNHLAMDTLELF